MKRSLRILAALLFALPLAAQIDIGVTARSSQAFPIGGGPLNWTGSGTGNFNNNFIISVTNPDLNVCFLFTNNDSNSHTFNPVVWQTADPTVATFTGNTAKWTTVSTYGTSQVSPATVAANSVIAVFAKTSSSSRITLQLSGGSGTGTVSVFALQTNQVSCGPQPDQPGIIQNQESTATASLITITINPAIGSFSPRGHLYSISGRCSAGTAGMTVTDGGSTVWSTGTAEVGTTTFRFQWVPGFTSRLGLLIVNLTSCGVSNVGTLDIQSSSF